MAPFAPFSSDAMYRNLSNGESVHLSDFPEPSPHQDAQVEADMARARQAVEAGLAARDAARMKVRQPLASIALPGDTLPEDIAQIVREELNVKELVFGAPELAREGLRQSSKRYTTGAGADPGRNPATFYSYLRATMGSTFVARRAGM